MKTLCSALTKLPIDWILTPVKKKAPYLKNWTQGLDREQILSELKDGKADGFGLITGEKSGGIVALDCDGIEAERYAFRKGVPLSVSFSSGKPGRSQILLRIPEMYWGALASRRVIKCGEDQLEIRWNNCQSVLPPSAHPETGQYQWTSKPNQSIAEAPLWVIETLLDQPETPKEPTLSPTSCIASRFPLEICLSKASRTLITDGAGEGQRNSSGAALSRDLIGTANRLDQLGLHYDGDPQGLFEEFCDRCTPPITARERKSIWKSAEKSNPSPSLSDEAIENCLAAWKRRELKEKGLDAYTTEDPLNKLAASGLRAIPPYRQNEGRYHELWIMMSGVIRDLGKEGKNLLLAWDQGRGEWGMSFEEKLKTIPTADASLASLFYVAKKHGFRFPTPALSQEWNDRSKELENFSNEDGCRNKALYKKVETRLCGVIRWNELRHAIEIDGQELSPESIRMQLALDYGIQIDSKELAEEICLLLAKKNKYNPVTQYFDRVAQDYPKENADLLGKIASTYLHTDDPLYDEYLHRWLISVVARAYSPGCKVDTVLTLQGGQGCYKSTFFESLCHDREWFDDSYSGQLSDKDEKLKFHFSLICEWAELDQIFKRRDAAACKNVISSGTDKVRPPYARKQQSLPRPSVIVSTANSAELLDDPTGDRRWWIIPINKAIDNEGVRRDRDQIWAAAVHAYRAGQQWHLPPEWEKLRGQSNERFQSFDVWQELIGGWIENRFDPSEPFTSLDVLIDCLKIDPERIGRTEQNRVGAVLRRLGYDNSRRDYSASNGQRSRVWVKIEKEDGSDGSKSQDNDISGKTNDPSSPEITIHPKGDGSRNGTSIHPIHPIHPKNYFSGANGQTEGDGSKMLPPSENGLNPDLVSLSAELSPAPGAGNGSFDPSDPSDPSKKLFFSQGKTEDGLDQDGSKLSTQTFPLHCQAFADLATEIQPGDRVIPQGKARWIRKGSQPLPKYLIPKGLSEAEEIEIGAIDGDLFHDLTSISRVIELSADAQRIKVMSAGGRKSVFPIEDVVLFQGVE